MDNLAEYKKKRSSQKTPEPFTSQSVDPHQLFFVVQKHQAQALHYDFRLEHGGVMPSWAIPKGPSLDPKIKRLAIQTEDHPLDYRRFEGHIPQGNYGAGTVMVWDQGTYYPEIQTGKERVAVLDKTEAEKQITNGLKNGEIKFFLHGQKLKGSFTLVRTRNFGKSSKPTWLLIKHQDKYTKVGYDAASEDFSAQSSKTLAEITDS